MGVAGRVLAGYGLPMSKIPRPGNGSSNGSGHSRHASLCVLLCASERRSAIAAALRGVGFCVHEFDCGAAFLLSEHVRSCDGLVAEFDLTGMTLPELMRVLAGEGLFCPVVFLQDGRCSADERFRNDPQVETMASDAPPQVLVAAVRAVLGRRTR